MRFASHTLFVLAMGLFLIGGAVVLMVQGVQASPAGFLLGAAFGALAGLLLGTALALVLGTLLLARVARDSIQGVRMMHAELLRPARREDPITLIACPRCGGVHPDVPGACGSRARG